MLQSGHNVVLADYVSERTWAVFEVEAHRGVNISTGLRMASREGSERREGSEGGL